MASHFKKWTSFIYKTPHLIDMVNILGITIQFSHIVFKSVEYDSSAIYDWLTIMLIISI